MSTSPVYCSHFTLGNAKKSHFQEYYSYILHCKMHSFFIWLKVCCIPPNAGGSEKSQLWWTMQLVALRRTGCDMWQMVCQTSNVKANVQSVHLLHGYMLPVFFATDQLHCPPRCAEIQPCRNKTLSQLVHIADWWYLIRAKKVKKMKNLCTLQGSAITFFRCDGWGSNSLFSSAIT